MKNKALVLLVLLLGGNAFSQLQNPSFEAYTSLPTNTGQFSRAIGWSNAGSTYATPDYYHYLANESADIPQTPMGVVNAPDGNAIMGFCASGENGTNFREYLSTQFTEPLEVGKEYTFSFKISSGVKTDVATSGLAVSNFGINFSVGPLVQNETDPILLIPTFRVDSVMYCATWKQLHFTFTPTQPFNFLTLGVFYDDSHVEIEERVGTGSLFAYYFVDDFYLKQVPEDYDPTQANPGKEDGTIGRPTSTTIDFTKPFFVPNSFTPNGDGKNDIFIPVAGAVTSWELNIYNTWGNKLFSSDDPNIGWDGTYNGDYSCNGSYVWEVNYRVFDDESGWIAKSERGTLQLIR